MNAERKTIYIAGPMTGQPQWNFPAFFEAEARLAAAGWHPVNPARNDGQDVDEAVRNATDHPKPWVDYMRADLRMVLQVDAVAFLPGWQKSRGAALEHTVATALGLPLLDAETLEPLTETIAEEAQRLVWGDRGDSYGPPTDDFARTGRMWGAILGVPDVPPDKVGLCMVALKLSRQVHKPKRDNLTDGIGYLLCVDRVLNDV